MGTPEFAVSSLEALIDSHRVVGVVTQPDRPAGRGRQLRPSPVKVTAQHANIPIYQPKSLRSVESIAPIAEWQPEVIVVAAFGQILRPHLLTLPPHGCINVHASLLPRWRGASPIQHAILAGDAATGVTLMKMDEGLDTGPMYIKEMVPIGPEDTAVTLHDQLAQLGAKMLKHHLDNILNGRLQPTPQDNEYATYAPLIKKGDGEIDWNQSNLTIDRHIRGMTPWPGAKTTWQGEYLKIIEASPVSLTDETALPGCVVRVDDTAVVMTKSNGIRLHQIQLSGKKSLPIDQFLNGHPELIGSTLGKEQ